MTIDVLKEMLNDLQYGKEEGRMQVLIDASDENIAAMTDAIELQAENKLLKGELTNLDAMTEHYYALKARLDKVRKWASREVFSVCGKEGRGYMQAVDEILAILESEGE